jgi:hypothetical protein
MLTIPKAPAWVKEIIRKKGYCALYVAGPVEPVAKRIGANRGARPIRIGTTRAWEDTISQTLDHGSWSVKSCVLFRVWFATDFAMDQIGDLTIQTMKEHADPMRKNWFDLGPELDIAQFQISLIETAHDIGFKAWSDEGLLRHLSEEARAQAVQMQKRAYA